MESYCIYEVFRPSARTGARLRIYAECCPNREEAAREIHARVWDEVQAVVAPGRGSGVVHRVNAAERASGVVAEVQGGGSPLRGPGAHCAVAQTGGVA